MTVTSISKTTPERRNSWRVVAIAFGAGIVAAMHIGKLPPAMGAIQSDLGAGLITAGWIASVISAIGTLTGLVVGGVADRMGPRRILIMGMAFLFLGSVFGGLISSPKGMLLARFIEGMGFTATTVSAGILIARVTVGRDRSRALAIWASFMPLGFSAMLLLSVLVLNNFGWRPIWFLCAGISGFWALVTVISIHSEDGGEGRAEAVISFVGSIRTNLRETGAVLVAACYALYAAQHIGMMVWLPTILQETHKASALAGAGIAAMVLLANAGGNYLAAWQLGRGTPIWCLLFIGAIGMLCVELLVFREWLTDVARILLLLAFGVSGGLVPASALAAPPVYAPSPALVGVLSGLMVMATNLGQLAGPPILAASRVAAENWGGTVLILSGLAVAAAISAVMSARFESASKRRSQS